MNPEAYLAYVLKRIADPLAILRRQIGLERPKAPRSGGPGGQKVARPALASPGNVLGLGPLAASSDHTPVIRGAQPSSGVLFRITDTRLT